MNDYIERKAQEAQQAKAAQWEEIQEKAPCLAKFMTEMKKEFGKLNLKSVEFK